MILTFFKSILILTITSLAINYSQNFFRDFSILVCIGVQVFFRDFFNFLLLLSHKTRSMKLRVHCFFFLVFLHIQTDDKNKLFFYNHINIQIRRFFSELVESNSLGKYSLIMIRIGMNTALLALSLGM